VTRRAGATWRTDEEQGLTDLNVQEGNADAQ
jgi:hypothetical protein